jgi:hypothetical protein
MTQADEPRPSIFGLARRLVSGVVELARLELTQGRQEIGEMVADTKVGVILLGIAAALGLLALITVDIAIVLGVAALFEAVASIVVVVIIVSIFVLLAIGFALAGVANAAVIVGLLAAAAIFGVPAYLGFTAGWFAALFVLVLQMTLVGLFALRGIQQVRIGPPKETIESVKEDIAWAKRLLRRG